MIPGGGSVSEFPVGTGPAGGAALTPDSPAKPIVFANGQSSAHVAGIVGVIGAATILAAKAALFAPPPPQLGPAEYQHGTHAQHHAQASQYARTFGQRAAHEVVAAAPTVIRPIFASGQPDVQQPAAQVFGALPVVATPIRPFEAGPQSSQEQPAPLFKRVEIWQFQDPTLRPIAVASPQPIELQQPKMFAAPGALFQVESDSLGANRYYSGVQAKAHAEASQFARVFGQRAAHEAAAVTTIVRPVIQTGQGASNQPAPQLFKAALAERNDPTPRTLVARGQDDLQQPLPAVWAVKIWQFEAPPIRPFEAGPQDSPEQQAAVLRHTEIWQFQDPPIRPIDGSPQTGADQPAPLVLHGIFEQAPQDAPAIRPILVGPQDATEQPAGRVWGRSAEADRPTPRTIVARGQEPTEQPQGQVFGATEQPVVQAPPNRPFQAGPGPNPEQRPSTIFVVKELPSVVPPADVGRSRWQAGPFRLRATKPPVAESRWSRDIGRMFVPDAPSTEAPDLVVLVEGTPEHAQHVRRGVEARALDREVRARAIEALHKSIDVPEEDEPSDPWLAVAIAVAMLEMD